MAYRAASLNQLRHYEDVALKPLCRVIGGCIKPCVIKAVFILVLLIVSVQLVKAFNDFNQVIAVVLTVIRVAVINNAVNGNFLEFCGINRTKKRDDLFIASAVFDRNEVG